MPVARSQAPSPGAQVRVRPAWVRDLDGLIGDRPFSVSVGDDGDTWYQHRSWVLRPPASNEKLLLSMVLLDRFATWRRIVTELRAHGKLVDGVLHGDLWLVGHGDPDVDRGTLNRLVSQLETAGIRRMPAR